MFKKLEEILSISWQKISSVMIADSTNLKWFNKKFNVDLEFNVKKFCLLLLLNTGFKSDIGFYWFKKKPVFNRG